MKIRFIFLLLTGTILLSGVELPEQMEPRLPRRLLSVKRPS